jgi:hypothetical protein
VSRRTERLVDRGGAALHQALNHRRDLIWHKIGDPHQARHLAVGGNAVYTPLVPANTLFGRGGQ